MKNGWEKRRLGEVTTKIGSGATPLGGESAYKDAGISLIRSLNVYDDGFRSKDLAHLDDEQASRLDNVIVEPDDVLLNITGASIARCCIVPEEYLPARVNQHVSIVRVIKQRLQPKFLRYMLISGVYKNRLLMAGEDGGTTRQAITKAQIQEFEIAFPEVAEQHRIVGVLDKAFEHIEAANKRAEANAKNAAAIFESQLQSVFDRRGQRWVDTTLEQVLLVQPQNGWSPPAANHSSSGTPVLTLSSVTGFRFRPEKRKFTSAVVDFRRHYWVKNGDLLITRSNTPDLVGHVAIAKDISEATIYPDLIMRMKPSPDRVLTEFLYYQLRSPSSREEITGRARGANPTMKKLSNQAVRTLPISVPPLEEQTALVDTLRTIAEETGRLAAIYDRKITSLKALKGSLLHRAFAGELTAGQAEELIEAVA